MTRNDCKNEIFLFIFFFFLSLNVLILVLLNPDTAFANSVDPDQSEEANWSGSVLFAIKYVNL